MTENITEEQIQVPIPRSNISSEYITEDGDYIIQATRYTFLQRIQHWVNLIVMLILFATGLEIFAKVIVYRDFVFTQDLHLQMGYFIFYWGVVIYIFMLIASKKFKHVIPLPRDFIDLVLIVGCALRIFKDCRYPHYDFYCPEKKKYIMKYHPTQKLLAAGNLGALVLIGITGFALYKEISPSSTGLFVDVATLIAAPFLELGLNLRVAHFILFVYFVTSTSIHFYFAVLLKVNRGRLRGMILGKEKLHFTNPGYVKYIADHENPCLKDRIKNTPSSIKNSVSGIKKRSTLLVEKIRR